MAKIHLFCVSSALAITNFPKASMHLFALLIVGARKYKRLLIIFKEMLKGCLHYSFYVPHDWLFLLHCPSKHALQSPKWLILVTNFLLIHTDVL